MPELTGAMIEADRKERKLSRAKYAELVGLTPTKIHNIEHGRALRPEEAQLLSQFIDSNTATITPIVASGEAVTATVTSQPAPPVATLDWDDEEELWDDEVGLEEVGDATPLPPSVPVTTWVGTPARYDFRFPGYHVSNSELRCFKRCRRKWYLAYFRELRLKVPEVSGPRALGTRVHLALSAYYSTRHEDPREVLEASIAADEQLLNEMHDTQTLDDLQKDADLARAMLDGYLEWVQETGADEGLDIIADEVVVEAPLNENIVLVGKMDVRARRLIDGARLFIDHKTVGNFTQPVKTLHMDEQMLHYHLLEYLEFLQSGVDEVTASREHSAGGLYNMLKKVKRTSRANPPFYERVEVQHNMHELRSYWLRVVGEIDDIMQLRTELGAGKDHRMVAYANPRGECSWDCDFIAVCPMFDDGSAAEEMLDEYFEQHDVHDHYYPHGEKEVDKADA